MGPLIGIVFHMIQDFVYFTILYLILIIMFAQIGLLNFTTELKGYRTLFDSFMTVLDISVGKYDFRDFLNI